MDSSAEDFAEFMDEWGQRSASDSDSDKLNSSRVSPDPLEVGSLSRQK